MKQYLTPNALISSSSRSLLILFWVTMALLMWTGLKPQVFPNPVEVLTVYPSLWEDGLGDAMITSMMTNLEALTLCILIGLPLVYLSRVPAITPLGAFIAKMRFVGPSVLFLPLLFLTSGGHQVKVALLTFGQLVYFVTTLTGVVANLPEYKFDDARTLKMSEWLSIWYVVIRGTVAEALDAIRDNAAMGWAMLMFVEGLVRSEGGVGVMMLNMEKHVNFSEVYAIAIAILMIGISQDWLIGQVKKVMCPYAS